jgi:hypothetical protein
MSTVYSFAQIKGIAQQAGLSDAQATVAALVALAESGGNPTTRNVNKNGTVDVGLWQINTVNWPSLGVTAAQLNNPYISAQAMVKLSKGGKDFSPWSASAYEGAGGGWEQRNPTTGAPQPQVTKSNNLPWYGSWSNPLGGLLGQSKDKGLSIGHDLKTAVTLGLLAPGTYGLGVGVLGEAGAAEGAAAGAAGGAAAGAAGAGGVAGLGALVGGAALVAWFQDPKNLLRVAYVVGGGTLMIVGAAKLTGTQIPSPVRL